MSMQKDKGSGWEREVAAKLTEVFGSHFNRNIAGSGNYIGGSNAFRKNILTEGQLQFCRGDISVPEDFKKMIVECKFYKDFPFHHFLIDKPIPQLDDWIQQQLDIIDEDSFWFVCFKINRCGAYIVINEKLVPFVDGRLKNHSIYHHSSGKYIVTEFENFIELFKEEIKKASC